MRRILAAAVALAPLCMASSAFADDVIGSGVKGPVTTSANGNITVNSSGSVTPGALTPQPGNCALNQAATPVGCPTVGIFFDGPSASVAAPGVTNSGSISNNSLTTGGATGILILGGNSGSVTNIGTISLSDGFSPPVNNTTGLVYGQWSKTPTPQDNYGIRLIGPNAFSGSIQTGPASVISISGVNSTGISIETALDGSTSALTLATVIDANNTAGTARTLAFQTLGAISVTGDNSVGVNIGGKVTRDVLLQGSITATGQNAVGVQTSADINGRYTIGAAISSTAYHYTSRPIDSTIRLFNSAPYTVNGVNT
jgi:hypothetical protein